MDATSLLAPLLVLTTLVERVMESAWTSWERFSVLAVETLIKKGNNQVEKDKLARDPDYVRRLLLDDPGYKERKKVLTLVVGSLIGIGLSIMTGVHFFEMTFAVMNLGRPTWVVRGTDWEPVVDVLITGLIIGAGSQPAHALINWISYAQRVQQEVAELRKGERQLADAQILRQVFDLLGVPPDTMLDVFKLMDKYGVRTLDDLLDVLRSHPLAGGPALAGAAAPPLPTSNELRVAENLKAVKDYLALSGTADVTRLLP